jgi:ubiquinone biosynthesis protein COQ9
MSEAKPKKSRSRKPPDDAAIKRAILEAALPRLAEDGFIGKTLNTAAATAGVDASTVARLFPKRELDLVDVFSEWADDAMEAVLKEPPLTEMKVRARIKAAVSARIIALRPYKDAERRAAAFLTLPQNASTALKLLYRTVDRMWRLAGDTSTDFNFYTKRLILAGVYSSTMLRWFNDASEDEKPTFEFLDARIENVMQFEKFKAEMNEQLSKLPSFSDLLGTLSGRRPSS